MLASKMIRHPANKLAHYAFATSCFNIIDGISGLRIEEETASLERRDGLGDGDEADGILLGPYPEPYILEIFMTEFSNCHNLI